jgi:hypothetical protein
MFTSLIACMNRQTSGSWRNQASSISARHLISTAIPSLEMMYRVAASQPRMNRVHIYMLPAVWLVINAYLLQEMNDKVVALYHDNDICVPAVKHGIFLTPDKRIQLTTIEREREEHHKFDQMIAFTREHIVMIQQVCGLTFGIGARVRHPKVKSEQDKAARKYAKTNLATVAIITPSDHIPVCHPLQAQVENPITDVTAKVSTAPVKHDIRINNLTVLPSEATIKKENIVSWYISRGLDGVVLLYDWASHRLTVHVGYNTPIFSETSEDLFEVFKSIVAEFSSDEEENVESYLEKGKHFFYREEMHDVFHYYGGSTVRVAPSLRHYLAFIFPHQEVWCLIAIFLP